MTEIDDKAKQLTDDIIMRLRDKMSRAKITHAALAEMTGVGTTTISTALNGRTSPTLATLAKLAVALDMEIEIRNKTI